MWGTESCVSPTDPWIGQQNTKLSSDSWKKGPVCSHGLEGSTARAQAILEASGTLWKQFLSTGGQEDKEGKPSDGSDT